ncbi:triple tyrosine motif-containing protein [Eisenibacter elegans]|uniref:triple tyrosine motif-containing protein n=1 Tax=Eisenibacter elegans TaxID=997 RepID=UPI0004078355|nr:triple tyrosine motif-containing protein [Eisenibacter elegans]
MLRYIVCILFIAFGLVVSVALPIQAQDGDYFLQNYEIPLNNLDNKNLAVVQGNNGYLYFANTKGILVYDGVFWQIIETLSTPYALAKHPSDGTIYVGCKDDYGYLERDLNGVEHYRSAIPKDFKDKLGKLKQIHFLGEEVFFYGEQSLIKVQHKSKKYLFHWLSSTRGANLLSEETINYTGFFIHEQQPYLNIRTKGLHKVAGQQLQPLMHDAERFKNTAIRSAMPFTKVRTLLAFDDLQHYVFDGLKLIPYRYQAEDYLKANLLNFNYNIDDNRFLTTTLTGGCLMLNKADGAVLKVINYQTGLPDDEVLALTLDQSGSLWVCHEKGISRIDLNLPLRLFSTYAGLDGNVTCVLPQPNGQLYVGTSQGVFFLTKVKKFDEVKGFIKKEARYLKTVETVTKVVQIQEPIADKGNNGLRLNYQHSNEGRKAAKRQIRTRESTETEERPTRTLATTQKTVAYERQEGRQAYATYSIPYVYKPFQNLYAKAKQFSAVGNQVFVGTNTGLYLLNIEGEEGKSLALLEDVNVNYLFPSTSFANTLYVCTDKGVFAATKKQGFWEVFPISKALREEIYSAAEQGNMLWLGMDGKVASLQLNEVLKPIGFGEYTLEGTYTSNSTLRVIDNKVVCFLSSGVRVFDGKKGFVPDTSWNPYYDARNNLIYDQQGYTWSQKDGQWQNLQALNKNKPAFLAYLGLFDDIENLYQDAQGNLWVVNQHQLYRLEAGANIDPKVQFALHIRQVRDKDQKTLALQNLVLNFDPKGMSFHFQLAAPYFQNERQTQYQYWLQNLENRRAKEDWSGWSEQNTLSFPMLPAGRYRLHVKAKNTFGQESPIQVFDFTIKPPFWETMWFYALQVLFFLSLLVVSFFVVKRGSRISRVLTLVTLITFFEFLVLLLEPTVDDFSGNIPVFKLVMNIILALSIAPIEHWLRERYNKGNTATPATPSADDVPSEKVAD